MSQLRHHSQEPSQYIEELFSVACGAALGAAACALTAMATLRAAHCIRLSARVVTDGAFWLPAAVALWPNFRARVDHCRPGAGYVPLSGNQLVGAIPLLPLSWPDLGFEAQRGEPTSG
jgi:hypothetical protein